jgi:hypothetical protein
MPDVHRIKIKLGDAEFEAEGAEDKVQAQYDQFLAALERAGTKLPQKPAAPGLSGPQQPPDDAHLARLFELRNDGAISLRVRPEGLDAADIVAILLYGYLKLKNEESVLATQLLKSSRVSGLGLDRIDRAAESYMPRYIMRGGQRKGTSYTLTTQGITKAEEVAALIIE